MNKSPIVLLSIMALTGSAFTYANSSDNDINVISNIQFVMNNQSKTSITVNMPNAGLYGPSGDMPSCDWQNNDEDTPTPLVKNDAHSIDPNESGYATCHAKGTQGEGYYYTLVIKSMDADGSVNAYPCTYEFSSGSSALHQVYGGFQKSLSTGGQCPLFTTMSYDKTTHTTVFSANFIHSTGEKPSG